jgi:serine/threonine protein kinase
MIGKVLKGIYRIYDKVGSGGFATVYVGRNLQTNEIVAIKVLREEYTQEPRFVKRFRREAHLAQSLHHPNMVRMLDYGVEDGQHFLVMDYVEGKTVAQIIHERGPLPLDQALSIVTQTCQALDHASRAGIVHRDIKPHNLMVTPDGMVKVMDLGIAKGAALATMTQSGHFMGTPRYISPEMAKGQKTDIRSDLYSLGIVLYEMLTGKVPFEAESPWAVLRDQIETVPRPLTALRRGLPAWLETVVAKALAKEPADRFQTPAEMLVALQAKRRVVTPAAVTPPPEAPTIAGPAVRVVTPAPERRLSPLLLAVLVAALALVVVMAGVGIASMIKSRSAGSVVSATKPPQTAVAEVPTFTPTRAPTRTSTPAVSQAPAPSPTEGPTSAPTATPRPTNTPTDTLIPTDTAIPTSTLAPTHTPTTPSSTRRPTSTLRPTQTPTPTGRPTNTPAPKLPTATPASVPHPAPTLREPPDGAGFSGKEAQVILRWDSVGLLAEDEYYVVVTLFTHGQETWRDEHWVKETSFQVPTYLPENATSDRYEWSVTVMRQTGTKPDGMKEGMPIGPASVSRSFTWRIAEAEAPTPTPPW